MIIMINNDVILFYQELIKLPELIKELNSDAKI